MGAKGRGGFTLLEVLITMAALAIVSAIALPSYFNSAESQRRAQAATTLRLIRQAEQLYESTHGVYTTSLTNLATLPPALGTNFSYTVAIDAADPDLFTATANRVGGPVCTMTINQDGQLVSCVTTDSVWNGGVGGGAGL